MLLLGHLSTSIGQFQLLLREVFWLLPVLLSCNTLCFTLRALCILELICVLICSITISDCSVASGIRPGTWKGPRVNWGIERVEVFMTMPIFSDCWLAPPNALERRQPWDLCIFELLSLLFDCCACSCISLCAFYFLCHHASPGDPLLSKPVLRKEQISLSLSHWLYHPVSSCAKQSFHSGFEDSRHHGGRFWRW